MDAEDGSCGDLGGSSADLRVVVVSLDNGGTLGPQLACRVLLEKGKGDIC